MTEFNTEAPDLETKIIKWANDRDLIEGTTAYCQLRKLREEILEAEEAINNGNRKEIVLELGDCYVVMVNLAAKLGMSLHVCGEAAYEKIKDRKGKMVDGTFVKESDLDQNRCHNIECENGYCKDQKFHTEKNCPDFVSLANLACPTAAPKKRGQILQKAHEIINGERQDSYGRPEDSFKLIAEYWNVYLIKIQEKTLVAHGFDPKDYTLVDLLGAKEVAEMMMLFKIARMSGQKPSVDCYTDLCGYAGIAADMVS